MVKQKIEKMKRRANELQKEIRNIGPVMRGSVVHIGAPYRQYYFSLNKNKKTKLIFLGKKRVEKAREYSGNYKKLLDIIEEMTILNMKLLKEKVDI